MTDGHKHWTIKVKQDSRIVRFMRKPRLLTDNVRRVDRSPYPYGILVPPRDRHTWYYLSILSVLHRWTGLELEVYEP